MAARRQLGSDNGGRWQPAEGEWVMFQGGELEGRRPRTMCPECRERRALIRYKGIVRADRSHTLCFQCYRAELDRTRARRLVSSEFGDQHPSVLPFQSSAVSEKYADLEARRRQAQIAARHLLEESDLEYPDAWRRLVSTTAHRRGDTR